MLRRMFLLCLLGVTVLLNPVPAGAADLAARVAEDFRPVSGYVVMPVGDEFLIDLDAGKGVREGDLFAVVKPGEKIVHPVTKEVIGSLDEVKGYLQVTRVKSGYSYARPLQGAQGIERGAAIRRYESLPALFWDYTGAGEDLYTELRTALPHLDWRSYRQAQANRPPAPRAPEGEGPAQLIFVFNEQGLGVKDGSFRSLGFYDRPTAPAAAPTAAAPPPAPAAVSVAPSVPALPMAAPAPSAAGIVAAPAAPVPGSGKAIVRAGAREDEGVWYSPELKGEPAGIAVGDFDGDGRQETAIAYPGRIELLRLAGRQFEVLGSVDLGYRPKAVALAAADLTGDGRPELYVTAADGKNLVSLVVECSDGVYRQTITDIPWYLRTVELPGEGPVLLGQSIGSGEDDFSGPVFRVERRGKELVKGAELSLPRFVEIYGFTPFQSDRGPLFANLSVNDNLQILTPSGEKLWQSDAVFGGREAYLEREDPDAVRDVASRYLYLKARLATGPEGEVLVPVNEGSRLMSKLREFKTSRLVAMTWDGYAMRELWHTRPQSGYLADYQVADVDNDGALEVAMAVLFSHKGFLTEPRSSLLVYELQ